MNIILRNENLLNKSQINSSTIIHEILETNFSFLCEIVLYE